MKGRSILIAVAVAAAALVALTAGPASATVLCKVPESPCPEHYPVGTEGTISLAGSALIETTGGTTLVTCNETTISGFSKNTGGKGEGVVSGGGEWKISECTNTVTVLKVGEVEVAHIPGTHNGTVVARGTQITVNGIFGSSCVYGPGAGNDLGTAVGGSTEMSINAIISRQAGGFTCPADVRWTATYQKTSPGTAVYVEAE